jgi:hypothetical protein
MIVEASNAQDTMERNDAKVPGAKKPYHKPKLTKYQQLTEITLGIQCGGSFPPCSPLQDPFN